MPNQDGTTYYIVVYGMVTPFASSDVRLPALAKNRGNSGYPDCNSEEFGRRASGSTGDKPPVPDVVVVGVSGRLQSAFSPAGGVGEGEPTDRDPFASPACPAAPGAVAGYNVSTLSSMTSGDSARMASRAGCGGALSRWMRATAAAAPSKTTFSVSWTLMP